VKFDAEANSDLGVGTGMWICVSMCVCVYISQVYVCTLPFKR